MPQRLIPLKKKFGDSQIFVSWTDCPFLNRRAQEDDTRGPVHRGCRFLRLRRLQISRIWKTCCVLDMVPVAAPQGNVPVLHSFIPARALKAAQRTKGDAWRTTAQCNMGSSLPPVLPDRAEVGRARSSSQDSARRARGLAASPPSIWDSQELG